MRAAVSGGATRRSCSIAAQAAAVSTYEKAGADLIFRVMHELAEAGDETTPTNLGHDRRIFPGMGHRHRAPSEAAADDALDSDFLAERQLAPRVQRRYPRRDAGAGRRAIYLALSEDCVVAAMHAGTGRWSGDNRPIHTM
jgi:hypothetical protein